MITRALHQRFENLFALADPLQQIRLHVSGFQFLQTLHRLLPSFIVARFLLLVQVLELSFVAARSVRDVARVGKFRHPIVQVAVIWTELVAHAKRRETVKYFVGERKALRKGTSSNQQQSIATITASFFLRRQSSPVNKAKEQREREQAQQQDTYLMSVCFS